MESRYYLQIQGARGIGAATQRAVLKYLRMHDMDLETFFSLSANDWQLAGLMAHQAQALKDAAPLAEQWLDTLTAKGVEIIGALDPRYPQRLRHVVGDQAPLVLYAWGNLELLSQPAVGFCGSRNTTIRGIEVAQDTATQIAEEGWSIVSGHARGIDTTTHQAALQHGGTTVIVAPEGILHFRLRREIRSLATPQNTLIVSEFQPNAQWSVINAMTRNRTICGVSDALVVIQAGKTGGTFEAGKFALQAQVPLFVAEYAQTGENGPGNPFFLERGARPLRRNSKTGRAMLDGLFTEVQGHYAYLQEPHLQKPQVVVQERLPFVVAGEPF